MEICFIQKRMADGWNLSDFPVKATHSLQELGDVTWIHFDRNLFG